MKVQMTKKERMANDLIADIDQERRQKEELRGQIRELERIAQD